MSLADALRRAAIKEMLARLVAEGNSLQDILDAAREIQRDREEAQHAEYARWKRAAMAEFEQGGNDER